MAYSAADSGSFKPLHVGKGSPKGGQFTASSSGGASSSSTQTQTRLVTAIKQAVQQIRTAPAAKPAAKPKAKRTAALRMGAANDPSSVRKLQMLLSDLKLGKVDGDGSYGQSTADAVKAAQQKLGLKPTGTATKSLVDKLAAADALSPCTT